MRIAIASGKGGAGKTMLTASLHSVWPKPHILLDCDVEAPNLHFFVHPHVDKTIPVLLSVPDHVNDECSHCGKCREICRYGAIAQFGKKIALFPDMCHGCGGCFAVCPEHALHAGSRTLGTVELGSCAKTPYLSGKTRIGEVMTPPLLRRIFAELANIDNKADVDVLLDSPPGVSCPAVTVASRVDAIVLVADSTPFGLADFCLAYEAFRSFGRPLVCVLNRSQMPENSQGDARLKRFCEDQGIAVVGEVPFDKDAALALAQGKTLADLSPAWHKRFEEISARLLRTFSEVHHG